MTEAAARNPLLDNSIFILTGGYDVMGNVLLSVPTTRVTDIGEQSVTDLTSLFLRMMEISRYMKNTTKSFSYSGTPPIAFLADLRQAPTQVLYPLVEVLEAVEHNQRGTIAAVYFLKPKSSSKSHILKKLLGVKPSKKRPRAPLFKIVLMKTIQELYAQVDVRFLTSDFSGTLTYSHHAWMYLYENVVVCIEEGKDLLSKLPSIRDRVDLLQEYEPDGQSSAQLQQLLTDLTEKFHHIITESSLPNCLTRCKQTLFSIDNISSGSLLSSLHPNLLSGFCSYLHNIYSELDQWNKSLEDAWRITESHFMLIIQYNRHNEKANEIERKICDHYYPLLKEHPIVGRTLSQAELYRAHFTTTLYEPAKELLSQATEILEAMQKVKTSAGSLSTTRVSSSLVEAIKSMDISSISKRLTTSIQPFTVHMQQLQELYVSIHVFHLLFEKALSWYKKVLKFLPESLLHSWTSDSDISQSDPSAYDFSYEAGQSRIIYMPPEWLGAVRVFLERHPPPREEHINRLDVSTPNVVDKKLRAQARSLALRLRLLQRVLSSTRLPLKLLMAVTGWKFELFGTSHSDRSPGHTYPFSHTKDVARNSTFQAQSEDDESTAQENKWVSSSNAEEARNDSSGTTSQSKKSVYFDQSTTSSLKSLTDKKEKENITSKVDHPVNKRVVAANKIQTRKNSKTLLRAKSVEFSFNSSSTDGSVFDYEKAVSQAKEFQEHEKQEEEFLKIRSGLRNAQKTNKDERFVHMGAHGIKQGQEKERFHNEVTETSLAAMDRNKTYFRENSPLFNTTNEGHSEGVMDDTINKDFERKPDRQFPSAGERYIGLSYRSWPLQQQFMERSGYHSMDDLLQADQPVMEEEFESGIDTMDHTQRDPYDLVVKKIKDISASNLPNFEKLKYVSTIIANSQMTGQETKHQLNAAKQLSFSSYDLRERNFKDGSRDLDAENGDQYKISQFPENPVEAVVRMKKNLAKSMENLSTYQLSMLSDEGGKSFSKLESPSPSLGQNRYLTKLKIQPSYANSILDNRTYETIQMSHPTESNWLENYNSQAEGLKFHDHNTNRSTRGILPDINEVRPSSDSQMQNKVSQAAKRHSLQHTLSGLDEEEQQAQAALSNSFDNHWQQSRKMSLPRPTNLSFSAGRTFISPSFLRPASSMRNISTQGQENLTFDLLKSMNLDSEKDLMDSFENKASLEENANANSLDMFSQENVHDEDTSKNALDQGKDDSKPLRRKFPSFEQPDSGYKKSFAYFKRPLSLSVDPTVYPVFNVEEERHNLTFNPYNVDRLNSEAELAGIDQEEVASSLLKTQQILEEEEQRRIKGRDEIPRSNDEKDVDLPRGQLIQSESIDNGYGSWASKLVSPPSSSSEGTELDNTGNSESGKWMESMDTSFEIARKPLGGKSFTKSSHEKPSIDQIQDHS